MKRARRSSTSGERPEQSLARLHLQHRLNANLDDCIQLDLLLQKLRTATLHHTERSLPRYVDRLGLATPPTDVAHLLEICVTREWCALPHHWHAITAVPPVQDTNDTHRSSTTANQGATAPATPASVATSRRSDTVDPPEPSDAGDSHDRATLVARPDDPR